MALTGSDSQLAISGCSRIAHRTTDCLIRLIIQHQAHFLRLAFSIQVDDQQVGLEVAGQAAIQFRRRDFGLELAHQLENRFIDDHKTRLDGVIADGLDQVALA